MRSAGLFLAPDGLWLCLPGQADATHYPDTPAGHSGISEALHAAGQPCLDILSGLGHEDIQCQPLSPLGRRDRQDFCQRLRNEAGSPFWASELVPNAGRPSASLMSLSTATPASTSRNISGATSTARSTLLCQYRLPAELAEHPLLVDLLQRGHRLRRLHTLAQAVHALLPAGQRNTESILVLPHAGQDAQFLLHGRHAIFCRHAPPCPRSADAVHDELARLTTYLANRPEIAPLAPSLHLFLAEGERLTNTSDTLHVHPLPSPEKLATRLLAALPLLPENTQLAPHGWRRHHLAQQRRQALGHLCHLISALALPLALAQLLGGPPPVKPVTAPLPSAIPATAFDPTLWQARLAAHDALLAQQTHHPTEAWPALAAALEAHPEVSVEQLEWTNGQPPELRLRGQLGDMTGSPAPFLSALGQHFLLRHPVSTPAPASAAPLTFEITLQARP